MRLERFVWAKAAEVRALRDAERRGLLPKAFSAPRPSFTAALRRGAAADGLAVIAEYKCASPSRGLICADVTPEEAARAYAAAGASCLSVLTEEKYFGGDLSFLNRMAAALDGAAAMQTADGAAAMRRADGGAAMAEMSGTDFRKMLPADCTPSQPLLRKDFIFNSLQVTATAATRASALLLIVRMTPQVPQLRALREQAEAAGMDAVVEVFDEADLRLARESGARLIQVNARDLDSLRVDRAACLRLAEACPPQRGECWIAASGMDRPEHLHAAADAGFTAALIGSALMAEGRPGAALTSLRAGLAALRQDRRGAGHASLPAQMAEPAAHTAQQAASATAADSAAAREA